MNDNTREAEGPGELFASISKTSATAGKMRATNVVKNLGRVWEIGAKFGNAAVSRKPKAAISTTADAMNTYQTGKRLYVGKRV